MSEADDSYRDPTPRPSREGETALDDEIVQRNRWGEVLGVEIVERTPSRVRARVEIDERHHQPFGIAHGGVYCSIVEDVASQGAGLAAREAGAAGVVGVSNSTDFLRSHGSGELRATAEPVHIGRSTMLWQVVIIRAQDGKLVARGQVRFHVLAETPDERRQRLSSAEGDCR